MDFVDRFLVTGWCNERNIYYNNGSIWKSWREIETKFKKEVEYNFRKISIPLCLAHSEYSDPSDCRHSSKSFISQFFCSPEAMPFTQLNWFFSPPCIFCNFIVCSKEFYAQQKTVAQYNEQFSFWYLAVKKASQNMHYKVKNWNFHCGRSF